MGEEKKEEANKAEKKEEEKKEEEVKGEEKKAAEAEKPPEIVLKVDMHCEACARKVARALKGFEGVEEVRADYKASKVVVKAVKNSPAASDPAKVCQRVQKKTGRKVELISPLPKPPTDLETQQQENQQLEQPKPEENKQEPPAVITVVLKVQMHCEACGQVLQKRIGRIKGVESVATDIANNQVIVKGVVDPENLVNDVYKRTHKHASIVKKEDKKEEKKDEVKEEEKQEDKKQAEEGKEEDAKTDVKKMEHWPSKHYMEYAYAPHIFSDENPNACSVM